MLPPRGERLAQFRVAAGRTEAARPARGLVQLLHLAPACLHHRGEDELRESVRAVVEEVGATEPKDMGAVMKALMPKVKGRADGKAVQRIVVELLS